MIILTIAFSAALIYSAERSKLHVIEKGAISDVVVCTPDYKNRQCGTARLEKAEPYLKLQYCPMFELCYTFPARVTVDIWNSCYPDYVFNGAAGCQP